MKKTLFTILLLAAGVNLYAQSYDFSAVSPSGHVLYYKFDEDSTLSVVSPHNYDNTYNYDPYNTYTGDDLIIPDSVYYEGRYYLVTSIGDCAFTLYINNSYYNSFSGGWYFTSVTIPKYIRSIYYSAFYGCHNLRKLIWNAQHYSLFDFDAGRNGGNPPCHLDTLVIGEDVETLPTFRWRRWYEAGYPELSYTYPKTLIFNAKNAVRTIVNQTDLNSSSWFVGFDSITECSFGNEVISLPSHFLEECNMIDTIFLPNTIKSIGDSAFINCQNMTILLPVLDSLEYIGVAAFKNCQNLYGPIQIPSNAINISPYCYYNCPNVYGNLVIPESVVNIGEYAFADCPGITGLSFLNNPQVIGEYAFYNCDNILTATINAHLIGNNAFANCDRLVSVTLGDSVLTVLGGAFRDGVRLQTCTMGDGVEHIGNNAFEGCYRMSNFDLGSGVTSIGNRAFKGCSAIHDIHFPEGLTTIGDSAFYGCSAVRGILTFPSSIQNIGNYAFRNTGSISKIVMRGATPPTIFSYTFSSSNHSRPVEVPCGAVMNYYITDYWEEFNYLVEGPPHDVQVLCNNPVMGSVAVEQQPTCTNNTAIIRATANDDYHFICWSDGNGSNPRQVQVTQDTTFTAVFVVNNSYIDVMSDNPLMGYVSGGGTYGYLQMATLTATANNGYHFLKWNDGNTQNPRQVTVTQDSNFTAYFVSNMSNVTAQSGNPSMGSVSGSGVYYYQNTIVLLATPNYGYHFTAWSDGVTDNPRNVYVLQDSIFTAFFDVNYYSVNVSVNSQTMGSASGTGSYAYLHEMQMEATPAYGYHFVQWNDQNTDNPRTITVTRDSAFTAQFAANRYTITAEPNDPTMGSAYGSGTYNYNSTVTLTAVETYGYHFTQWSDGVTDNPRIITVQNNATYTAQFAINSYILTVQSSNPAIGTTSGGGSYNYMTPVNITAIPNVGYHFTQWSDGNTDNPRLVTVVQNATYTAQFAINSYAVSVTCNNSSMGSVSGSGTYNHNSIATLTATAYYGYHFVQWQDGNTENPRTVVVTDSAQYTAQFDFNSYLITANSSNVTLGSATGGGSYNYLSQVALTAVPVPHYHFTMWNDSIEDNPRTITVTRDSVFTAHFAIDRHTIAVHTADATQGTTSGSDTVDYNTAVWISATANYGYHFTQWQDGATSNPRRVVVSKDTVFTASFAPNQYTATCGVNDNSRGTVATTGGSYSYLTSVTFTAIPNGDYHFLKWSNGSTENPVTFTITRDTTFTAILVGLTANVNNSTMGTVTHSKPSNLVEVVTATANYGYHFVQWNDGVTDNPRTVVLTGDSALTAIFAVNNYYVTLASNDSTLGAVQGEGEYAYQSNVTITAVPVEHSHFVQWSDGNTSNPRVVTVTRDTSFTAVFERDPQYTITVVASDTAWGVVSGGGVYYAGETVVLTATPRDGYHFEMWSDGNTQNPRSITVIGDVSYTAVFAEGVGIEDVELPTYRVYVRDSRIVVEGVESEKVQVFDVTGRKHSLSERLPMGVYVVKIGEWVTKKVVVM